MIERATGYQDMYDSMCLPLRSTKKKASDGKQDMFLMHAFLRVLPPYFDSAVLGKHGRETRPDKKMIACLCSTNPESFKRFWRGRVWSGTFPMETLWLNDGNRSALVSAIPITPLFQGLEDWNSGRRGFRIWAIWWAHKIIGSRILRVDGCSIESRTVS